MSAIHTLVKEVTPIAAPKPTLERDKTISDAIAPGSVIFERNYTQIDENYRKIYMLRNFRTLNHAMWCNKLYNHPRTLSAVVVKPGDPEKLIKAIDHTDARSGVFLASGNGSASKSTEHQINRDHARTMLNMMADEQKSMVDCQFIFQTDYDSEREMVDDYRNLSKNVKPLTILDCPKSQEKAYRLASPLTAKTDDFLTPQVEISMPVDTLAASMPFNSTGILDATGTELGVDASGSLVRVDMLEPSFIRTNMNAFVTGESGKGKSRLLKMIAASEYAKKGSRVIWIDPEGEAVYVAKKLHGQVIKPGGERRNKYSVMLCPLQPRAINYDFDEDLDNEAPVDVLRSTINFLRGFYQLAFGVTNRELPYLDRGLVEAYSRHGLTYDTPYDEIDFNDYPSMDELASVFRGMADKSNREEQARIYDFLADQTETGGANGLYGNLWSGHTNIDFHSDFIVFDIHSLVGGNISDAIKNAQMYSILTFIWGEICKSRVTGKPLRLIIDEGHMLFGTKTDVNEFRAAPIAAAFVCMIIKRARKYNTGVLFATQQNNDMVHESVKEYGEAVVTQSAYQFIFGTKATEVQALRELCDISEGLARKVLKYNRGQCILKAGTERTYLRVKPNPAEDAWIGSAGGR